MNYRQPVRSSAAYWLIVAFTALVPYTGQAIIKDTTLQKSTAKAPNKKTFYGQASFYSDKFNGRRTASGEIFSQSKLTCASNILKMGTWIKVTNLRNGKTVEVKVNDRLHPNMKRIVDLTRTAAKKLGFTAAGLTRVKVEVLPKKRPSAK